MRYGLVRLGEDIFKLLWFGRVRCVTARCGLVRIFLNFMVWFVMVRYGMIR